MMGKSINELFGIDFDTKSFIASAKNVVTEEIIRNVERHKWGISMRTKEISDRFPALAPPNASNLSQLIQRFIQYKNDELLSDVLFSNREIRLLCYNANQVATSQEDYHILIDLIQKRWRQSYLNGLVFCLLYNWSQLEYDIVSKEFRSFVITQLSHYEGQRSHLRTMKSNIQYLKDGGSTALGQALVSHNRSLLDAPGIIGLKERDFVYSYFSKTIQYYCKNTNKTNSGELTKVLTIHANSTTTKIVVSDKIIKAKELHASDISIQTIKRIALKLVGDPFVKANWNTIGIEQENADQIKKAYSILKKWMIKSFIDLAFQYLIDAPDRRFFWLKYVDYIEDLKIVGTKLHENLINGQPDLKKALGNCFHLQASYSTSKTCAVAIQIRDHYFFEFSDVGACYVYNNDRKMKMIEEGIRKANDLKEPSLSNLIEAESWYHNYNDYGRVIHSDNWQYRLSHWFYSKLNIYA